MTIQLMKKWQRMASTGRKRVRTAKEIKTFNTSVAAKGNCIIYTVNGRRFEIPLAYLNTMVIGELLRMSQEEFGFTNARRSTLPCEAEIMEYVMHLLQGKASEYVRTVLRSLVVPWSGTNRMYFPSEGAASSH